MWYVGYSVAWRTVLFVSSLVLTACPASSGEQTGTDGTTSSTTSDTPVASSTTTSSTSATSTGMAAGGSGSSSTGVSCETVEPVDNPETYNCNLSEQDCPDCHKCTHAWDGGDGFPPALGTVCVPVDANPVATLEPCSHGAELGHDNCGDNAFCWSPDATSTDGYCVEFCETGKTCGEGFTCVGGGDGPLGCLPTCDPFTSECPDASEQCGYFNGQTYCAALPEEVPAEPGAECFGVCGAGFACVPADAYGASCEFDACCTPLCDAEHPCADAEQSCAGDCGEPPEGLSVCVVETEPSPGQCPPEDAEPNYPWCSDSADECGNLMGGGNDCVSLCFCNIECETAADCPVPETGTSTVECTGEFSNPNSCMLSCANGETCPNGMYCADALYPGYCMWFVEEEPGCTER